MANFGNTCALICRIMLVCVLIYSIVLSSLVVSSCHFISAVTPTDETHGVGLATFESEGGSCTSHNSFVREHYNGMEMAAKVGGYVAPTCASLVVALLLLECCQPDGLLCGKCIPGLLLLGAEVCQCITFLLFSSELFCSNRDIDRCVLGEAAYRSIQACLVYAFCFILYYCSPNPEPFTPPSGVSSKGNGDKGGGNSSKRANGGKPGKNEEWTKEMYEQRRRDKKVKSRGVSGRSKKEIFDDLKDKDSDRDRYDERQPRGKSVRKEDSRRGSSHDQSLTLYDPDAGRYDRRRGGSRYDDYVDEPDGMDWSAYTPEQRDAYYERKRSKRERGEGRRERESQGSRYDDHRGSSRRGDSRGGYYDDGYDDDGRSRDETYYSERDMDAQLVRYDDQYTQDEYTQDEYTQDEYTQGEYTQSEYTQDERGTYYSESRGGDYDRRSSSRSRGAADSYTQGNSYYEGEDSYYADDSPGGNSYYDESPRSRSSGRSGSRGTDNRRSNSSYYDSYDDRGGYRDDDPSFA